MRMNDLPQGEKYIKSHRFHKRWHKVLMFLSSIVAFCTVYALILPAITMERECQLPEHTHTTPAIHRCRLCRKWFRSVRRKPWKFTSILLTAMTPMENPSAAMRILSFIRMTPSATTKTVSCGVHFLKSRRMSIQMLAMHKWAAN